MRGVLDSIYWKLHTAFLRNERKEACHLLDILDDELAKDQGNLVSEIGPIQMLRCRKIIEEVRSGTFRRLHGDGVSNPSVPFQYDIQEKTEDEKVFQRKLFSSSGGKTVFLAIIGAPTDAVIVPELDLKEFGRCDLAVFGGRRAWVVELKIGETDYSVISQIDKYLVGMELDMCLGLYDEVTGIVMAEKFPSHVASELSRNGIRMIQHFGTTEKFRIV